jgi:hypothetical protein
MKPEYDQLVDKINARWNSLAQTTSNNIQTMCQNESLRSYQVEILFHKMNKVFGEAFAKSNQLFPTSLLPGLTQSPLGSPVIAHNSSVSPHSQAGSQSTPVLTPRHSSDDSGSYDVEYVKKRNDFGKRVISGFPVSWFSTKVEERNFKKLMEKLLDEELTSTFYNSYLQELKGEMARFKDMLNKFEALKVTIYIENIFEQVLKEEEDTQLELDIAQKMSSDPFVGFLLTSLNFRIVADNHFDVCIKDKAIVSLKDKFLNILQNMDTQETRKENIGLLLYVASRLYSVQEGKRVYLISMLRSSFFGEIETWEYYFLHRINKKISDYANKKEQTGLQKTLNIIKTPLTLFGVKDSSPETKGMAEKEAKNKKEFHPAIFMEIAQHLALLNVTPEEATNTLIALFKKYDIGSNLMQSVFIVHQKNIAAQFEDRVQSSLSVDTKPPEAMTSFDKLEFCLTASLHYLPYSDSVMLLRLSKAFSKSLLRPVFFNILKARHLTLYQKATAYKMVSFYTEPVDYVFIRKQKCLPSSSSLRSACSQLIILEL